MDTIRAAEKLPDGRLRLTVETVTETVVVVPPPDEKTAQTAEARTAAIKLSTRRELDNARKAQGGLAGDGDRRP